LILFYDKGGIDVGDVDAKACKLLIPTNKPFTAMVDEVKSKLFTNISSPEKKAVLFEFIYRLHAVYSDLNFTYLEINPLVVLANADGSGYSVVYLDLAAKLDQTAEFESGMFTKPTQKLMFSQILEYGYHATRQTFASYQFSCPIWPGNDS
jgi:ATP citrate (pro-S)-lyase